MIPPPVDLKLYRKIEQDDGTLFEEVERCEDCGSFELIEDQRAEVSFCPECRGVESGQWVFVERGTEEVVMTARQYREIEKFLKPKEEK